MKKRRIQGFDQPIQSALDELQELIRRRFPTASFAVSKGEDPEGLYLRATVDVDDIDDVVDQTLLDRLFDLQVERNLPIYVVPLQPVQRVLRAASFR